MNISQSRKKLLAIVLAAAFSTPAISTAGTMSLEKNVNPVTVSFADSFVVTAAQRLAVDCDDLSSRNFVHCGDPIQ